MIRILEPEAGQQLLKDIAQQLCNEGLPGVGIQNLPKKATADLFNYITNPVKTATALLEEIAFTSASMKLGLLLLRGLFAGGVFKFALSQKRWRVSYGLDPSRSKLAVPYLVSHTFSSGQIKLQI